MGEIKEFYFKGKIAASKSLFNRALIVQSFFPELQVHGETSAEDVKVLRQALRDFSDNKNQFFCGDGGTSLRFLLARLSRAQGTFSITGRPRLMQRPHQELIKVLQAMDVQVQTSDDVIEITSKGWTLTSELKLGLGTSSQFISALLLSAWKLPKDLCLDIGETTGSFSYLKMTCDFLKHLGMEINFNGSKLCVPKNQTLKHRSYKVEPDMSSAFTMAALGVAGGQTIIEEFPSHSIQPDSSFVEILKKVGGHLEMHDGSLYASTGSLQAASLDLQSNPDMFPVLAILLLKAKGTSKLSGLHSLIHKESNRIEKTRELIEKLKGQASWDGQCFEITGDPQFNYQQSFAFDADHDHRMAMAASVAMIQGASIQMSDPTVVNKSFPGYWEAIGL